MQAVYLIKTAKNCMIYIYEACYLPYKIGTNVNDVICTDKAIKHELLSELKITGRRRSIQTFSPASKCSLLSS